MVMKKNILLIFLGMAIMIIIIITMNILDTSNFFGIREGNEGQQNQVVERRVEMLLDEEQNRLVKDSIFPYGPDGLEGLNKVQVVNAWHILSKMLEVNFVENRSPGESGVGSAVYKLEVLGIGEINEVQILESRNDGWPTLVLKILTTDEEVYFLEYNDTWGLTAVSTGQGWFEEDIIYDSYKHEIFDGRIWNVD